MSWMNNAIEKAGEAIEVDVRHLNLDVETIQIKPLTANEYHVLKAHPDMRNLSDDDKTEQLGMLMVCEMMKKCDKTITWSKMKQMPLTLIGSLSTAITSAIGTVGDGGGSLGE
tara:strand:- start:1286 stop:1624 length:339 start_codon:yes stop_codon:yes gene_type:complete